MLQQTRGDKQELSVVMYKKDVKTKRGVLRAEYTRTVVEKNA
jgi:hypothetical protein